MTNQRKNRASLMSARNWIHGT